MRFYTLAWFYNAQDTLLHIRSLQFDPNTPHRVNNDLFGGTEISGFEYDLHLHCENRIEDLSYADPFGMYIPFKLPYVHEVVQGSALIHMDINLHSTELWAFLTRGEPLSKIIVRLFEIQESGRLEPFVDYTFKECWLFDHTIRTNNYQIKFTYCCAEIHFHDGNRFAKHQRCVPFEPTESQSSTARSREASAHDNAGRQQVAQEASRIVMPEPNNQNTPVIHRFDVTAPSEFNGKVISPGGLDEVAFHVVEEAQSVDELINSLHKEPSEITRTHFKLVNNHLSNNIVLPAQVVLLSAEDSIRNTDIERHMRSELHIIENYRQNMGIDASTFAHNFVDYGNAAGMTATGISFGTTYFQHHINEIQKVLKELETAFTKGFRMPGGALRYPEMEAYRTKKFKELNALTTKSMQAKIYGGMAGPKMARRLRLKPQLIEHNWKIKKSNIIPSLSQFYINTAKFEKAIKASGYLAVGLGALATHSKIKEACMENEKTCTESKYMMWTGFAGSTVISTLTGMAVGGTIALIVGLPAIGLGGIVAVGIAAVPAIGAGYYAGEFAVEPLEVIGEIFYRKFEVDPDLNVIDEIIRTISKAENNNSIEIELLNE